MKKEGKSCRQTVVRSVSHASCFRPKILTFPAVQNERDRISCRRPSYEDSMNGSGVSIQALMQAELYYREVSSGSDVPVL